MCSCEKNEIQEQPISSNILELKNVRTLDIKQTNSQNKNSSISELKEITVNLNGEELTGRIAFLNKNSNTQRIAILGKDDVIYSYVDIVDNDGIINAKYYTQNGQLYLEATLQNEVIKIVGAHSIKGATNSISTESNGSNSKRVNDYIGRFGDCVEGFVRTVQNDAGWSAVMTVGAICCAAEILTGLGIGCAVKAI